MVISRTPSADAPCLLDKTLDREANLCGKTDMNTPPGAETLNRKDMEQQEPGKISGPNQQMMPKLWAWPEGFSPLSKKMCLFGGAGINIDWYRYTLSKNSLIYDTSVSKHVWKTNKQTSTHTHSAHALAHAFYCGHHDSRYAKSSSEFCMGCCAWLNECM